MADAKNGTPALVAPAETVETQRGEKRTHDEVEPATDSTEVAQTAGNGDSKRAKEDVAAGDTVAPTGAPGSAVLHTAPSEPPPAAPAAPLQEVVASAPAPWPAAPAVGGAPQVHATVAAGVVGGSAAYNYAAGYSAPTAAVTPPAVLSAPVQARVDEMVAAGHFTKEDLDSDILRALSTMPPEKGLEAMDKFVEATARQPIANKRGFLGGIVRRLQDHSTSGVFDPGAFAAALARMPPSCQAKVTQMYASGQLTEGDIEPKVLSELMQFGEAGANVCLDRFTASNLTTVRSKTAFMIGIIKRYRNEVRQAGGSVGGYGMMNYGGQVDPYAAYGGQAAYQQYAQQWAAYYAQQQQAAYNGYHQQQSGQQQSSRK